MFSSRENQRFPLHKINAKVIVAGIVPGEYQLTAVL